MSVLKIKNQESGTWEPVTSIKGPPGPAATIQIGTVTSGDTPSVTNSGTENAAVLDFVLQRGPQGETGRTGPQGENAVAAITPRGDYDAAASPAYTVGDYVTYSDGNAYVCKVENAANAAPTDGTTSDPYWQLLALQGAAGQPGKDGFSPTITESAGNTDVDYKLTVTNAGGSFETPNLKALHTVSNAEVYSTEETVIGTWIDGKPIYRKTLDATTPSTADTNSLYSFAENGVVDKVISLHGVVHHSDTGEVPLNFNQGSSNYISAWARTTGDFVMRCGSYQQNQPVTVIIEYTKTTDTATT